MYEQLKINKLVDELRQGSSAFTDVRTGENNRYAERDAAMSAIAVFITQTPSFLAHQRDCGCAKDRAMRRACLGWSDRQFAGSG